jgi:phage-related minor tail protein
MANVRTIKVVIDAGQAEAGISRVEKHLTNVERAANKASKEVGGMASAMKLVQAAIAAVAIDRLVDGFRSLVDGAAKFQELADKTGASAVKLAEFSHASAISGVSMDSVASSMNKLTFALQKVDEESDMVAQGLKSIGIGFEDFKKMSPDERIKKLATALNGFEDGAQKTAVAMAILGKSGADQIPFLKDLGDQLDANQGKLETHLTPEMIARADEYGKKNAAIKHEMAELSQVLAIQMLPAVNIFGKALNESMKQMLGVSEAGRDLKNNNGVEDFGLAAAQVLGYVMDAAQFVARTLQSLGTSLGALGAMAASAMELNWAGIKEINNQANEDLKKIWESPWFSDNLKKQISDYKKSRDEMKTVDAKATKSKLDFNYVDPKIIKQAEAEFDKIKNKLDQMVGKIDFAKKAQRDFNQQLELLSKVASMSDKELKALGVTRSELEQYKERAAITYKRETDLIGEGTKAVQREIDALREGKFAREATAASLELENQLRDKNIKYTEEEIKLYKQKVQELKDAQRTDQFNEGQRDRLQALRDEGKLIDFIGAAREREAARLGVQREAEKAGIADVAGAVRSYTEAYDDLIARTKASRTVARGIQESVSEYMDKIADMATQSRDAMSSVINSLEDQLANFFKTGKFGFRDFVGVINSELSKIAARQLIGVLGQALGSSFGGFRADGGPVEFGRSYIVGERGPELFTPPTSGTIVPNNVLQSTSNSTKSVYAPTLNLGGIVVKTDGQVDARTVTNIAQAVLNKVNEHLVSETAYNGVNAQRY